MAENRGFIDIDALKAQVDADLAARIAQEAEEAKHIQRRSFWASGLPLLVALDAASEVVETPDICRLPGAPHGVRGLVNRHGRVVPVLDLAMLLGLPDGRPTRQWLLVCGRGEAAVGLVIDGLPERKVFDHVDAVNLAEIASPIKPYVQTAYRSGSQIWMDLDTDTFFAAVLGIGTA
jgi:chemotaxis signal transduction protein